LLLQISPDIRSSAQVAQIVADKYPKMEAAKDGFIGRNQLGNGNNYLVSTNDQALFFGQMYREINSWNASHLDYNKRKEGCNQILREVRPVEFWNKVYGSEITAGAKEGKENFVGLGTV
jgi:hypothetical protein